jgi:pteridine reductase
MLTSLEGKVVFVTGSARRVGRAILLGFAAQGANVIIHHSQSDADAERTETDARSLGVDALIVKGDYAHHDEIARNFEQIMARYGRIDVMVNSASIFKRGDLLDILPDEWDAVMNINLRAPFWCTQHAGRIMRDLGIAGSIINIGDTSGLRPWAARPHHSVSKAGLVMLTEVTAAALAPYGIRANCLVLGPVLPSTGQSADNWRATEARLPLKRAGDPEDAARAAVFLATNDYITGAVLRVDGGEWPG